MSHLKENDSNFLKSWQKLQHAKDSNISMSEKADVLRCQLSLLTEADSKGLDVTYIDRKIRNEYVSTVDFDESRKTLNNYAESILSNVKTKKADAEEWKSAMSLEGMKKLSIFAKFDTISTGLRDDINGDKSLTEVAGSFPKIPFNIPPLLETIPTVEKSLQRKETVDSNVPVVNCLPVGSKLNAEAKLEKISPSLQNKTFYFEPKRKNNSDENDNRKWKRRENFRRDEDCTEIPEDGHFVTGNQEMQRRASQQVYKSAVQQPSVLAHLYGKSSRSLGGVRQNFKIPIPQMHVPNGTTEKDVQNTNSCATAAVITSNKTVSPVTSNSCASENKTSLDPELVALIESEILELKANVGWDAIAGLAPEKAAIKEMVLWPLLRPDLFCGIRAPPKGLLLYGPPGTGKTLIGRCIASQAKATFFNISASSLTSKWVGEGEKLVRTLFEVARQRLPAVIFIDEVDSLLSQRSENEHESSRRMKTEFLQQLDGAKTNSEDRLLLVGATNRPHELDAAARRRFTRRIYIPLPDKVARYQIINRLLIDQKHTLTDENVEKIADLTENYSCADVTNLCKEAALAPLRLLDNIEEVSLDDVPPITFEHFEKAVSVMGSSVSHNDLSIYRSFNETFGYNNKQ